MARAQMSPERAEILGLEALTWLAADDAAMGRFLAASGTDGADLRAAVGNPGLTMAVLDFLLLNEDLLLVFCETAGIETAVLHRARNLLGP
jgi:hypothetical protein